MVENDLITLQDYAEAVKTASFIEPQWYEQYNVKRGLRNADGTGVLVGMTRIGDAHGYIVDEGEKVPVEGRLRYRGIDVQDLVKGFTQERRLGFEETAFLLLFGRLPNTKELVAFRERLGEVRSLPAGFTEDMILKAPSKSIMNKLARSVLAAYSYDENPEDNSIENVLRQCIQLISWFPVLVSYAFQAKRHYHHNEALFIHSPDPGLSAAENLLRLFRPDATYTDLEAELLDLALVIHAEHGGGNNSAFALRTITSSATDTYSAISAAVGSLKGVRHGGASNKVREMMDDVKSHVSDWSDEEEIANYLKKILNKEAFDGSGLIYGIGHAVYTLSDPRAVLLKAKARTLAEEKGFMNEFTLYEIVERLSPELFYNHKGVNKVLAANVDFYSGFVYNMLDIPPDLFTPVFAVARITGWSAHRVEELLSGGRIIRPAYKQIRLDQASYVPLAER